MATNPYESPQPPNSVSAPLRQRIRLWQVSLLLIIVGFPGYLASMVWGHAEGRTLKDLDNAVIVGITCFFMALVGLALGVVAFIGWAWRAVRNRGL